jgi:chromosome segregation ATPase
MLKKALIGTTLLLVTGAFVFGRDVFSYARTWGKSVRDAVKAEVPIEFEVERAREMVKNIEPDIRQCMHKIAEQQVDIEHRTREIAQREEALGTQKQAILTLRADLSGGKSTFQYASRTYTASQVKQDLAVRFERFKSAEESLSQDRQILAAREKTLRSNEEKLDTLLASKKQLEVQIEQLEARVKTVQAAEAASELEFDDSRLARTKKLIGELNKQLDVQLKMLDAQGKFSELIPVEDSQKPNVDNVTDQIDSYFGPKAEEQGVPTAAITQQPNPGL